MTASSNELLAEIVTELRRANDQREAFYREIVAVFDQSRAGARGSQVSPEVPGE